MSDTQADKLGPCRQIRALRYGDKILIKWHDPYDVFDKDCNALARWKHTILVRNYDHIPENVQDGDIVQTFVVRNAHDIYSDPYFIDVVNSTVSDVYYKAFAIPTEGEPCECEGCKASIASSTDLSSLIRDGRSQDMFTVGERYELIDGSSLYVADFDSVKPAGEGLSHSVTFLLIGNSCPYKFDTPEEYVKTNKLIVTDTDTQFYRCDHDGKFIKTFPLVGTDLTRDDLFDTYYERKAEMRAASGSNFWEKCSLRHLLKFDFREKYMSMIPQIIRDAIIDVRLTTKRPAIDGGDVSETIDNVWIPSLSQLGVGTDTSEGAKFGMIGGDAPYTLPNWVWSRTPDVYSETKVYLADGETAQDAGSDNPMQNTLIAFTIG